MLPKLVCYNCINKATSIFLIFSENRVLDSKFGVFGGFSIALKIGKSAVTSVFQQIRPNKWYQQILREKYISLDYLKSFLVQWGPILGQKPCFQADAIAARNTFSDITTAIYEVGEILNPPGLCIFLRGTRWWHLFCSILKNEGARVNFIRNLSQKVKKMMFFGPL